MKLNMPLMMGDLMLKTRIFLPPMMTGLSRDGAVTDEMVEYYRARTNGDRVGLMIVECATVRPMREYNREILDVSSEGDWEGLKRLATTIHKGSMTRIFIQISWATLKDINDLTKEELAGITEDFASAVQRCKEAGFDGVEIHSAHESFLNKFLSPLANHRQDEYGTGSIEDRTRLHVEILKAAKEKAGEDYLIGFRLGACDYMEGGTTEEEGVEAAKILAAAGADFLNVSGGMIGATRPDFDGPGHFREVSRKIYEAMEKEEVVELTRTILLPKCKVFTCGGVESAQDIEDLLLADVADMVGVGRNLYKDPKWIWKELAAFERAAMQKTFKPMIFGGGNSPNDTPDLGM